METGIIFWILFNLFVLILLTLDLFVFHRQAHEERIKEALLWSLFWIGLAFGFNLLIYFWKGTDPALEFLTAYLVEKSLSVDNLFVFILIFNYFNVPSKYQHRILFWGILGALIFRAVFILVGVTLIERFHFVIYVLGAFLVITGIRMALVKEKKVDPESNLLLRLAGKYLRVSKKSSDGKFVIRENGRLFFTPMFLVLLMVESTDIVFAVDSIPAILAISSDPFIVYTSNVFALLGLRALYFALAGIMKLFHYLHYGLALILVFIGVKLLISEYIHIDMLYALIGVGAVLTLSILASLVFPKREDDFTDPTE